MSVFPECMLSASTSCSAHSSHKRALDSPGLVTGVTNGCWLPWGSGPLQEQTGSQLWSYVSSSEYY